MIVVSIIIIIVIIIIFITIIIINITIIVINIFIVINIIFIARMLLLLSSLSYHHYFIFLIIIYHQKECADAATARLAAKSFLQLSVHGGTAAAAVASHLVDGIIRLLSMHPRPDPAALLVALEAVVRVVGLVDPAVRRELLQRLGSPIAQEAMGAADRRDAERVAHLLEG